MPHSLDESLYLVNTYASPLDLLVLMNSCSLKWIGCRRIRTYIAVISFMFDFVATPTQTLTIGQRSWKSRMDNQVKATEGLIASH